MDTTETITHLSLCSGYEGIGLGLRRVLPNLREIAYVEREGFPVANLVAKMEAGELDAAPVFTDVKTFPYGKFRGLVDILSGGFPCQPFSSAGKRKATDDPRHLFPFIAEGIRECRPTIVFLENVEGILSCRTGDGEPVLKYVLRTLEGLGYRATAGIFSASEVGAPHQRKRVFILGLDDSRLQRQEESEQQAARLEQSSEELADTEGSQSRLKTEWEGRQNSSGGSEEELGYSQHDGCIASEKSRETSGSQEEGRVQESQGGSNELAYSNSERGQRPISLVGDLSQTRQGRENSSAHSIPTPEWPARPNEPQHEWEEPRVIESQLGGATNGASSRVDRLRLLGNGVVPATAAKAFVTLIQRLV